jgi:hypothetical protein
MTGVLLAQLSTFSTAGIGYFTTLFTQNFDPTKLLGLSRCWPSWRSCSTRFVRRAEVHFGRRRAE